MQESEINLNKVSKERLQEILKENPARVYEQFGTIWGQQCSREQAKLIADMVKVDGMALVEEKYGFRLNMNA